MANIGRLETQIKTLSRSLARLASQEELEELLRNIHRPGWTTPAEFTLVTGTLDSMIHLAKGLDEMKQVLVKGSREVAV